VNWQTIVHILLFLKDKSLNILVNDLGYILFDLDIFLFVVAKDVKLHGNIVGRWSWVKPCIEEEWVPPFLTIQFAITYIERVYIIYMQWFSLKHFEWKMQRPVMPVCVTWTLEFKNESMQQLIDIRSQYSTGFLPSLHTHSIRHCHLTKATYSIHFSFQLQFLCFKHRWDPNHLWNHGWKLVLFVGQDGLGRCEHNTWGRWLGFVSFLRRKARFFGKLAVCY